MLFGSSCRRIHGCGGLGELRRAWNVMITILGHSAYLTATGCQVYYDLGIGEEGNFTKSSQVLNLQAPARTIFATG